MKEFVTKSLREAKQNSSWIAPQEEYENAVHGFVERILSDEEHFVPSLREFHDRGDFWLVEWTTRDGERHTSAIAKKELTVVSAGICLSGRDRDFDLQSLVGVVERQWGD